jgi:ABC-type nitrate/sulfonate/bicarbonate transport system substrate-binding protein
MIFALPHEQTGFITNFIFRTNERMVLIMKKRVLALIALVLIFVVAMPFFVFGESSSAKSSKSSQLRLSGKTLVVGTQAKSLGLPLRLAEQEGLFQKAGLNVKIVTFATGAPINQAMASGNLDVAVSGSASVYALATGMYTYIGDGCITVDGQAIYARPNSPIAKVKGVLKGTKGSAKTVKGCSILGPTATTAQYHAIKYVESFGLTSNDFKMVSMDFAQAYAAFIAGQGDLIATTPPFSSKLEKAGYVKVSDVSIVMGAPLVDTIFCRNDITKERHNDLAAFLECYYEAANQLVNDKNLRHTTAMAWYAKEGITYTDADMDAEIQQQSYFTWNLLKKNTYPFGRTMAEMGKFFTNQGLIEKDQSPNIATSINKSYIKEAIKLHEKQSK